MEDQENRGVLLRSNGILDILLVFTEKFGVELDITGLVDTVNITETGSDREVWGDWGKSLVDCKNFLWLGVKRIVVNVFVVDTNLLTASDTDFLRTYQPGFRTNWQENLPSRAIVSTGQHALSISRWSGC